MKKSLLNIGILLFIDSVLIYSFYFQEIGLGPDSPSFDRQTQWKIDVGEFFLVAAITYFLLREIIKAVRNKDNETR